MTVPALEEVRHREPPRGDNFLRQAPSSAIDKCAVIGPLCDAHAWVSIATPLAVIRERAAYQPAGPGLSYVLGPLEHEIYGHHPVNFLAPPGRTTNTTRPCPRLSRVAPEPQARRSRCKRFFAPGPRQSKAIHSSSVVLLGYNALAGSFIDLLSGVGATGAGSLF